VTDAPRKAIVIAAGRGRRLSPYTDEMPKCLVPVGARSILGWQLEAFAAAGIEEVVLVRGYLGDVLTARLTSGELDDVYRGRFRFVDNREHETNNVLLSLFCARDELDGPVLLTYSDIVFTPAVVRTLLDTPADIGLVIDRDFADIYVGRTEHPLEEAEVSDLDERGLVRRVGKRALPVAEAWGEFIGLAKLSAEGARWMVEAWDEVAAAYAGRDDAPFQRAARFRNAYLTDLLQHLIEGGKPLVPVPIHGEWREIDTGQDLTRARELLESAQDKEWK
jgi:choline kinase